MLNREEIDRMQKITTKARSAADRIDRIKSRR